MKKNIFADGGKCRLVCPICHSELNIENRSLVCERTEKKHCFDLSSDGYVNLVVGKKSGGDCREAVKSRSRFLSKGYYKKLSDKLCEIVSGLSQGRQTVIADAGCGEGYYDTEIAKHNENIDCIMGFDLSRDAVAHASSTASATGLYEKAGFAVSNIFDLPMSDGSVDIALSIFAPISESELSRILKNDGCLITVGAGVDHLLGLKKVLYDEVYKNEERADAPKNFEVVSRFSLKYTIELENNEDIADLFAMTPYYFRTPRDSAERLAKLDRLETELDFDITVYKKH